MSQDFAATIATLLAPVKSPVQAIAHSSEFERIANLPRRKWSEDDPVVATLTDQMTAWLRVSNGDRVFRPIQAIALAELYYYRGLFGAMRVGSGKTDVAYCAPTVLQSQRPVLCIPAKLRDKTFREFDKLQKHWRGAQNIRVISCEELSRDYGKKMTVVEQNNVGQWIEREVEEPNSGILDLADPDLIIVDEVHRFKNENVACTKKMKRYLDEHPQTIFVGLSGSITKRSIKDYAHILVWCLKNAAPLPRTYHGLKEWSFALDVKVKDSDRYNVGALLEFVQPEDWRNADGSVADERTAARRGYRRRLIETPGVVSYSKDYTDSSLYIEAIEPTYNQATENAFTDLRVKWLLPTGDMVMPDAVQPMSGMAKWSHAGQLGLGFYYVEDPPASAPWQNARTEWHQAVRKAIRNGGVRGIDSPNQVAMACRADPPIDTEMWKSIRQKYFAWKVIEPTETPSKKAVWIDYGPLQTVINWMTEHAGIVWCNHIEFAEQLAILTGAPYFGAQGIDKKTRKSIEDDDVTPKKYKKGIIASIKSNNEGRNLQTHWHENLITACPTGGDEMEQLLGRTHREGQPEDEVNAWIIVGCKEQGDAWLQAKEDSRYIVDGSPLGAKIFLADNNMPDAEELGRRDKFSARYGIASIKEIAA